ncbi:unnamed protein product, partial [Thlaspi arvense]
LSAILSCGETPLRSLFLKASFLLILQFANLQKQKKTIPDEAPKLAASTHSQIGATMATISIQNDSTHQAQKPVQENALKRLGIGKREWEELGFDKALGCSKINCFEAISLSFPSKISEL